MSIFIMLDVGGTEIKGGVFDVSGALLGGIRNFQAKAGENPDTIFENFCHIISDLGGASQKKNWKESAWLSLGLLIMNRASA